MTGAQGCSQREVEGVAEAAAAVVSMWLRVWALEEVMPPA